MKLKELNNLFSEIDYFKSIENRDDYYLEFIFLHGERDLLTKIEELYSEQGLIAVGKLFNLKTKKWVDISKIYEEIANLEKTNATIQSSNNKVNRIDRTRQTNSNNTNEVIPFDVIESVDNEKAINSIAESENNIDNTTMENRTVYSGFSKEKINHFTKKFENYKEYRYTIYKDIVSTITLQIYD